MKCAEMGPTLQNAYQQAGIMQSICPVDGIDAGALRYWTYD